MAPGSLRADGGQDDRPVVLVVDDEARVAGTAELWLDDCDVRVATSASEALEQYDASVDVVLVDRRMPGTTGDELLDQLVELEGEPGVGVLSAVDPDFDVLEHQFDLYVQKPVDKDLLSDAVDVLLERAGATGAVRELLRTHATLAALRASKPSYRLEDDERYQSLEAEYERLRQRAGTDPEGDGWTDVEQFAVGFGR